MRVKTHPGEILLEEYMRPLGLSVRGFATVLRVSPTTISSLVNEKRDLTPDMACRLAIALKTSPHFWMNLQTAHSLSKEKIQKAKEYKSIQAVA
jgi:addiction module HigA family antidote